MEALRIAASGMMAQQFNTDVVANNLANMNTTGYQRRRTEFSDLLYKVSNRKDSVSSRAGESVPSGIESGQGGQLASIYRVSEQGSLTSTSNTFDLAIQGHGYSGSWVFSGVASQRRYRVLPGRHLPIERFRPAGHP